MMNVMIRIEIEIILNHSLHAQLNSTSFISSFRSILLRFSFFIPFFLLVFHPHRCLANFLQKQLLHNFSPVCLHFCFLCCMKTFRQIKFYLFVVYQFSCVRQLLLQIFRWNLFHFCFSFHFPILITIMLWYIPFHFLFKRSNKK